MKISKPSSISIFQFFAAWVLVALVTCPGDAFHHGPMLIFKSPAGQGHGAMAAAGLLAAGMAMKLIGDMGKHQQHHGHGSGGGYEPHGHGLGLGMMPSLANHGANLGQYGYMPQMHAGWMRR